MRIGVLGGSFDPPHLGHWLAAVDAADRLALDGLVFVPAHEQPLKAGGGHASAADRLAMTRLMAGDDSRFSVDSVEIDRGGLSFTVDTLRTLQARHPDASLDLIVGADVLASFARWRDPAGVRAAARLVVLRRDVIGDGGAELVGGPPHWLDNRRVELSSTEVRARVHSGLTIRGFVPDAVATYIATAGLYR